jgi:hypothetical protein
MTINDIEEKDLGTVKKIREIVNQKEKPLPRKKVLWKAPGVWMTVLGMGAIVLGVVAFRQPSTTALPTAGEPLSAEAIADDDALAMVSHVEDLEPETAADGQNTVSQVVKDLPGEPSAFKATRTPKATQIPSPTEPGPAETTVPTANPARAAASETAAETIGAEKYDPSPGIQISHLVTCSGVREKQFVSPKSSFSLATDSFAMVWMRVLADAPPLTLTHVYSVNGTHYCDVPLNIPYPHMRTWSKVTINQKAHVGKWRVDVVAENGKVIKGVDFTVVP